MINTSKNIVNKNKHPSISFYNKFLLNELDISKEHENINNSLHLSSNNPIMSIKSFNKPKKELILAKLDTSQITKKKHIKKEEKMNIINKTINYDDSEGYLMAAKLSSSFIIEKNNYDSNIYYPKKKIRNKNELDNFYNSITKEKSSYISDNDIFESFPLEKYNRQIEAQFSASIKIQSIWRGYFIRKNIVVKLKIIYFINLLNKCIINETFKRILHSKTIKEKIYHKKLPEKIKNMEIMTLKRNKSFKNNELKIEEKINELTIFDNESIKKRLNKEKYNKNSRIIFSFSIEKYIKNEIIRLYYKFFFENLKDLIVDRIKQKQKIKLLKLINLNHKKNLKKFMNKYKEKILIEKTKQNIFTSLIRSKSIPKLKPKIKDNAFNFNFQYFYKQNILRDIIKKYRYTSVVQKYYFLWKKKKEKKENKKKKFIKIKKIKKNKEQNNILDKYKCKEDSISNVSGISNNVNLFNSNISSSIQSIKNIKGTLDMTHKKIRIKKVVVDHNYYEYIEKNNYYYTNFK